MTRERSRVKASGTQRSVTRRQAVVADKALHLAPRRFQRAFWQGHNNDHLRRTARLGDMSARILSEQWLNRARRLEAVRVAWNAAVPEAFDGRSEVDGLRGGCLEVKVDSAATRFLFSRRLGKELLAALNDHLGGPRVDRIDYRIGKAKRERGEPCG